jgi:hypothetical protein
VGVLLRRGFCVSVGWGVPVFVGAGETWVAVEVGGTGEGDASWLTMEGSAQADRAKRMARHSSIRFGVLDMDMFLRR